jgi:hypothetical protein
MGPRLVSRGNINADVDKLTDEMLQWGRGS